MLKKKEPRLRIGLLSDIHITDDASTDILRAAFEWFRDQRVDGVLIAGDLADNGHLDQLLRVRNTWDAVFPGDRLPDGGKVEKLFVYGNHDVQDKGFDHAGAWRWAFGEDYSRIYLKRVKGYAFVGAHIERWGDEHIDGLEQFLADHAAELQGPQPFFYFQHKHPKGTCSAPWTWGQDDGQVTTALSKFPNCIAFSGHSHTSLTDDRTIRQGDFGFTSVGTGSLRYVIPFGGRENSTVFGVPFNGDKQMPNLLDYGAKNTCASYQAHQGMVMFVYADRVTLARRDIAAGEPLGTDWEIPLVGAVPRSGGDARRGGGRAGARPSLSYEARAKKAPVPQMPAGAKVTVAEDRGKTMKGREVEQVTVGFPPARGADGARAFDYEVTAVKREDDLTQVAIRKRVFSPAYFRAESQEPRQVTCVFARDELPWTLPFRFEVRPLNCWGVAGKAIVSKAVTLKEKEAKK